MACLYVHLALFITSGYVQLSVTFMAFLIGHQGSLKSLKKIEQKARKLLMSLYLGLLSNTFSSGCFCLYWFFPFHIDVIFFRITRTKLLGYHQLFRRVETDNTKLPRFDLFPWMCEWHEVGYSASFPSSDETSIFNEKGWNVTDSCKHINIIYMPLQIEICHIWPTLCFHSLFY